MMPLQMVEEIAEPGGEEAMEGLGFGARFAERGGRGLQHAAQLAEHVVHLQPELRRLAEIAVLVPGLARVFLAQIGDVGRQLGGAVGEPQGRGRIHTPT